MARTARNTDRFKGILLASSVAVSVTVLGLGVAAIGSHALSFRAEANASADASPMQVNRDAKSDALPLSQAAQVRLERWLELAAAFR